MNTASLVLPLIVTFSAIVTSLARAKPPQEPPLACNMAALTPRERTRLREALTHLESFPRAVRELSNGYEVRFTDAKSTFPLVAEWFRLENRCCPFFDLRASLRRNGGPLIVEISGRSGIKPFIVADLPLIAKVLKTPERG